MCEIDTQNDLKQKKKKFTVVLYSESRGQRKYKIRHRKKVKVVL